MVDRGLLICGYVIYFCLEVEGHTYEKLDQDLADEDDVADHLTVVKPCDAAVQNEATNYILKPVSEAPQDHLDDGDHTVSIKQIVNSIFHFHSFLWIDTVSHI